MITASFRVKLAPRRRADVFQTLRSVQGPSSARPGCVACHVLRDAQDENVLLYVEEWGSREQLERHIRSDQYRRLLEVMELSSEPPEIRFDTICRREGIELVAAVREDAASSTENHNRT